MNNIIVSVQLLIAALYFTSGLKQFQHVAYKFPSNSLVSDLKTTSNIYSSFAMFLIICFASDSIFFNDWLFQRVLRPESNLRSTTSSIPGLGGKLIITGIGKVDEDEFTLNLFNEQVALCIILY